MLEGNEWGGGSPEVCKITRARSYRAFRSVVRSVDWILRRPLESSDGVIGLGWGFIFVGCLVWSFFFLSVWPQCRELGLERVLVSESGSKRADSQLHGRTRQRWLRLGWWKWREANRIDRYFGVRNNTNWWWVTYRGVKGRRKWLIFITKRTPGIFFFFC